MASDPEAAGTGMTTTVTGQESEARNRRISEARLALGLLMTAEERVEAMAPWCSRCGGSRDSCCCDYGDE